MPGVVKRKFDGETIRINKSLKRPLYLVVECLPREYSGMELLTLFQELYPSQWRVIAERCELARNKDEFLQKNGKKQRYKLTTPESYFLNIPVVKHILSQSYKAKRNENYSDEERKEKLVVLKTKRTTKITQQDKKYKLYRDLMQQVDPYYSDLLISEYHRKGITIEGKMEILKELQKFDTKKVFDFLYKLNDAERNNQIRSLAFSHLQASEHYVKLRKKFKGKQKSYMTEETAFYVTPSDLAKRLDENTIQSKKRFDVFISHSFKDSEVVKKVIATLNAQGLHCYCDWLSDNDFLKRALVSDYTAAVLKKRIEQSTKILFIHTDNSMTGASVNSPWIAMELEFGQSTNKDMYSLNLSSDISTLPFKPVSCDFDKATFSWGLEYDRKYRV